MSLITHAEVQRLAELGLRRRHHHAEDPKQCPWFPTPSAEHTEAMLNKELEKAKAKLASDPQHAFQWLSYALAFWIWVQLGRDEATFITDLHTFVATLCTIVPS